MKKRKISYTIAIACILNIMTIANAADSTADAAVDLDSTADQHADTTAADTETQVINDLLAFPGIDSIKQENRVDFALNLYLLKDGVRSTYLFESRELDALGGDLRAYRELMDYIVTEIAPKHGLYARVVNINHPAYPDLVVSKNPIADDDLRRDKLWQTLGYPCDYPAVGQKRTSIVFSTTNGPLKGRVHSFIYRSKVARDKRQAHSIGPILKKSLKKIGYNVEWQEYDFDQIVAIASAKRPDLAKKGFFQ